MGGARQNDLDFPRLHPTNPLELLLERENVPNKQTSIVDFEHALTLPCLDLGADGGPLPRRGLERVPLLLQPAGDVEDVGLPIDVEIEVRFG